jgi:hypothetical protein
MTKKEFAVELDKVQCAFPRFVLSEKQIAYWYSRFEKYEADAWAAGVHEYIGTQEREPTIAGLLKTKAISSASTLKVGEKDAYGRVWNGFHWSIQDGVSRGM